ncbi:glycosyltransferase [Anderseniella sp. Alg231-50]|uniref:glycosyltransferase n=1 Tax=Anderseniella sp. Alg231-50 TaxID=1922226 RepID=UPI000D55B37D
MIRKVPGTLIHYGRFNPEHRTGGVEAFARSLKLAFEDVQFLDSRSDGPGSQAMQRAVADGLPVVCDNHLVLDWPDGYPVIGFQHGVAAEKKFITRSWTDWSLARQQARAARRPSTLWVACARWISDEFARRYGNQAQHVVYHAVDINLFDGRLDNHGSKLVLHDGRSRHKGRDIYPVLRAALPDWTFEPLSCCPAQVPERMRKACAFMHLSRYEGNSIVCNEAMAMGLPCLFTRVGLMRDGEPLDVGIVDVGQVYGRRSGLIECVGSFLDRLGETSCNPRGWIEQNTSQQAFIENWKDVMAGWRHMKQHRG